MRTTGLMNGRLMHASLLAIAGMLAHAPAPARAQSFDAVPTLVAGGAFFSQAPGVTTVEVNLPSAVINWVPNAAAGSGPINFQPANTTALFTSIDSPTYAVLNRILPTSAGRPVVFNGTVISQVVNPLNGAVSRGGTLFFYSPGGIIIGPTGVFNVGNLALTASDVPYDFSTGSFGTAGTFSFLPANAGSSVEVQAGAQITAGPFASYVALVAPRVVNSGTITVDGATVLVAADASTITFRPNGLFDIQVDQGTSATGEVVTNAGTITGSAGTVNSSHRVYMVAVPRNDAITMAIKGGSTLGFPIAQAADVDGNAIVLSAGYDVQGGQIAATRQVASPGISAADTDLQIGAINATSQITGKATGQAGLTVSGGGTANFASNVLLSGVSEPGSLGAEGAVISVAGVGSTLDIRGNLAVTVLDAGQVTNGGFSDSGSARITVDQGSLTVGGSVQLDASRTATFGVDTFAGRASFVASGGATVDITGDLTVAANGLGKTSSDLSAPGPNPGTGGTARVALGDGSAVTVRGNLAVQAAGLGGSETEGGSAGEAGFGGSAVIEGFSGTGRLTVGGNTTLDATGIGGNGLYCLSCAFEGGTGTGGTAEILATTGMRYEFGGAVTVDGSGTGGNATDDSGNAGGAAQGGSAFVRSTGGVIVASSDLTVRADGTGGSGAFDDTGVSGTSGFGAAGGAGTGGTASLSAGDAFTLGAGGTISISADTVVSADGLGGQGGAGAAGTGGQALIAARNGNIAGRVLNINASGSGSSSSNGANGGAGSGGTAEVLALSALEGASSITYSTSVFAARGDGGGGGAPTVVTGPGGAGGTGTGGRVNVLAEAGNGTLDFGETNINVGGTGGHGGDGAAIGGIPNIGENGGDGGIGQGGFARLGVISGLDTGAVNAGSASFPDTTVSANGIGGNGGLPSAADVTPGQPGRGGDSAAGGVAILAQGGLATLGPLQVQANATGGNGGGVSGPGGNAAVGNAALSPDQRGVQLLVGSRVGNPAQRGTLVGAALSFATQAVGGGTSGTATVLGQPLTFRLDGGSINAASLSFLASGTAAPGALPSVISLAGGDTTLTGAFDFTTPGTLTAAMAGANLFSDTAAISAGAWLSGIVPAGLVGTLQGTTSVSLTTGTDIFGNFSVDTGGSLALTAGGRVRLDNLTAGGALSVGAGTTIALGNLASGSTVSVTAPGDVSLGNVTSIGDTTLTSGAALAAGGVTSRQSALLRGTGSLTLSGNVVAGSAITLSSDGQVTAQGLSAGLVNPSAVSGTSYDITAVGLGGISLGAVAAAHDIKLFTPLALTAGALSGREIALLSGGAQSVGSIAASGRVLMAGYALAPLGGDPLGSYDVNALLSAPPAASSGGSITVSGATTAGALTMRSDQNISLQGVTTGQTLSPVGSVNLGAVGTLTTGDIVTAGRFDAGSGSNMNIASARSNGFMVLNSGGTITTGNLFGGDLTVNGEGAVSIGTAQSGTGGNLIISSFRGPLSIVSATSDSFLFLSATGTLTVGDISGGFVGVSGGNGVTLGAISSVTGTSVTAAGNLSTGAVSDIRTAAAVGSGAGILLNSTGGNVASGNLTTSAGSIRVTAVGSAALGAAQSFSDITVGAGTTITLGQATADNSDIVLNAAGGISAGNLTTANGRLQATTGGAATLGDVSATGFFGSGGVNVSAGTTLGLGNVSAVDGDVQLSSGGALIAGSLTATAGPLTVTSGGDMTLTGLASSGTGDVELGAGGALSARGIAAAGRIGLTVTGAITTAALDATGTLDVTGSDAVTLGAVTAQTGGVNISAVNALQTGAVSAGTSVTLASTAAGVTAGNVRALAGTVAVNAAGAASLGAVQAATGISLRSGAGLTLLSGLTDTGDFVLRATSGITSGNLAATGGELVLEAGGALGAGNLSGVSVAAAAGTSLATGAVTATGGAVTLNAGGVLTSGGVSGDVVSVTGNDAVTLGAVTAQTGSVNVVAVNALQAGAVSGSTGVSLASTAAGVTAGNVRALAGTVAVNAVGAASLGAVQAATGISLRSGGGLTLLSGLADTGDFVLRATSGITSGNLAATGGELLLEAGGALGTGSLGNIAVTGDLRGAGVTLAANGTLAFGTATATGGSVSIGTAGAVTGGAITATSVIQQSNLAGAVTLGNLNAGSAVRINGAAGVRIGNAGSATGTVEVRANAGSLTTGTISAATDAALIASGDLAAGSVQARDMVLLAGGSISAADLASPTGRILAGRNTLGTVGGAIGGFDFGAVFAAPLVAASGGLTLTRPVSGGAFTAAVAGDAALLGVTASRSILVQSGGLLSLGGVLRAPQIDLSSNDIAMPAGSGLNAGLTGTIRLFSGNANGMRIGDGLDTSILPATSYTLDNAEWSRINSGSLSVFGVDGGAPVDILIGQLDMTGPDAGSTIDDPNGRVVFRTGEVPSAAPAGTIRVTGAVRGTGFRASNALVFQTGLFQLSSDTGSITLLGQGGTPLGAVQIEARDIHFAAAPLLARLAADPFFAGAEAALDNDRSGASGAVLSAGALDLVAGRTVYIQRTGTGAVPLGFDEPLDGFRVRPAGADPITVIINGTFRTAAGTVSGVNAWQLFKDSGVDLTRFTAESRLNGCLLNAATCSVVPPLVQQNPDPGIRTLFDLIDVPASDDREEAERQTTSPILPPQPVLPVQPEGLPVQIDEPIAGSGNPALFGSGPNGGLSQ